VFKSFGTCSLNRSPEPVKRPPLLTISQSHLDGRNVNLMIKRDVVELWSLVACFRRPLLPTLAAYFILTTLLPLQLTTMMHVL